MTYNPNIGAEKRKKPFEPDSDYVKAHRAIYGLYTQIPDFKSDHALMYIILMDYYNMEYGYAYPTKWELAHRLNSGENKPSQIAEVLERCGLIRVRKGGPGRNDVYYVYAPITDERKFYAAFPEAREYYDDREVRFENRRARHRTHSDETAVDDAITLGYFADGTPVTAADL